MRPISCHNHTRFSDGGAMPVGFLEPARLAHAAVLGFSDHFYRDPDPTAPFPDWALKPERETEYFETLADLAENTKDLTILRGLEFDWFDDGAALLAPMARDPRLDYTIGSIHMIDLEAFDISRAYWSRFSPDEINEKHRRYWRSVRRMAESGLFEIAGHLDLVKKFAVYPTEDMTSLIEEALDAVRASNMAVELNTSGWRKPCEACYPTEAILRSCFKREIPVLVSSDAHKAELVCDRFDEAYRLLAGVGYQNVVYFRERERITVPLV